MWQICKFYDLSMLVQQEWDIKLAFIFSCFSAVTFLQGTKLQRSFSSPILFCSSKTWERDEWHFELLTAMYEDGPACELSCKAALQPEMQHSSLPKPCRAAAAEQHCVPSNVTQPDVCLRLCKKRLHLKHNSTYSAAK